MKILVFGSAGQLGTELVNHFKLRNEVIGVDLPEVDITRISDVISVSDNIKPDVIINAAAYTDVDGCELNPDKAFLVNAIGARNIAIAANIINSKLIHISTDYVFDGEKIEFYREYDAPNPINIYGLSKLQGEDLIRNHTEKFMILRIAWLYGRQGKNFIKTVLNLLKSKNEINIVDDQWGTPTSAFHIVRQIDAIIDSDLYGTYNCTCQGGCTWLEYSLEILNILGFEILRKSDKVIELESKKSPKKRVLIKPISMSEFARPARRPKYCILDNYYLRLQGVDLMPSWQDALREFFSQLEKGGDIYESLGISRR